eukprot:Mrub_04787.p1 GENE.Mrub_04787~~Mrub_04787.p1  ORF type:complete len:390 (+),score=61.67 Mrub_04787:76-1170(+)
MKVKTIGINNNELDDNCIYNLKLTDNEVYVKPILKSTNKYKQSTNFSKKNLESEFQKTSKVLKFGVNDNYTGTSEFKQRIETSKFLENIIKDNLSDESSEPSLIDIEEKKDDSSFEVYPAYAIVQIKDCMNINAVELDSKLYIYESFAFSTYVKYTVYSALILLLVYMSGTVILLFFNNESVELLLMLFIGVVVLVIGYLTYMYVYNKSQPNAKTQFKYMLNNDNNGVDIELQYYKYDTPININFSGIKNIGIMKIKNEMFNQEFVRLENNSGQYDNNNSYNYEKSNLNNTSNAKNYLNDKDNEINIYNCENKEDKEFIVLETFSCEYIALSEYRKTLKDPIYSKIKAYIDKWKCINYENITNI